MMAKALSGGRLTVEVGGADEGDVDSQITMFGGAVKTQIDAKWY